MSLSDWSEHGLERYRHRTAGPTDRRILEMGFEQFWAKLRFPWSLGAELLELC
jgi:hypothetical protein